MELIYHRLLEFSAADVFRVLGIPVILFVLGFLFNVLSRSPFLMERAGSEKRKAAIREVFQLGLSLSLMGIGSFWSASYYMTIAHPVFAFTLIGLFICLTAFALSRILLFRRPVLDAFASNFFGILSVSLSFTVIIGSGI